MLLARTRRHQRNPEERRVLSISRHVERKARGRNRITGNRSVRSWSLAPLRRPPADRDSQRCPVGRRKIGEFHTRGAVQSIGHTVVPGSGRAYMSLPIATQAAAYRIVSAQNAARNVLSFMMADPAKARASM